MTHTRTPISLIAVTLRALGLISLIGLAALSCTDTPVEVRPPDPAPVTLTDSLVDFFPPLAIGDTLGWQYQMWRPDPQIGPYWVVGTITWTVSGMQTQGRRSTAYVTVTFTGTRRYRAEGGFYEDTLRNEPMTEVVITVDSSSTVTIAPRYPYYEVWYRPPAVTMPRYRGVSLGDTLFVQSSSTSTVTAKRDFGLFSITYTDGYEHATYKRGPAEITPPPPLLFDYFPAFKPGDTVSWDLMAGYASYEGPGYRVDGTLRWTVQSRTTTLPWTTRIMQVLSGRWIRWSYSLPETTRIASDTTYVSVIEQSDNTIDMYTPMIWQGSTTAWQGWLRNWSFTMPHYAERTANDTLTTSTGTASASGTLYAKRNVGPVRLVYDEAFLSRSFSTMVRR